MEINIAIDYSNVRKSAKFYLYAFTKCCVPGVSNPLVWKRSKRKSPIIIKQTVSLWVPSSWNPSCPTSYCPVISVPNHS